MTVSAAISDAQAALAFARKLELAQRAVSVVYGPELISSVRPVAEFTVSTEAGTFRVTVERVGEETER